jgi:hypothetical protein
MEHFLDGAATPPVQEGKIADRHIFLGITGADFESTIRILAIVT